VVRVAATETGGGRDGPEGRPAPDQVPGWMGVVVCRAE